MADEWQVALRDGEPYVVYADGVNMPVLTAEREQQIRAEERAAVLREERMAMLNSTLDERSAQREAGGYGFEFAAGWDAAELYWAGRLEAIAALPAPVPPAKDAEDET